MSASSDRGLPPSTAAPRRRMIFGAAAALLVTAFSLAAAEIVLRVADYPPAGFSPWIRSEALGFRLAPGIRTRMRGPEYDIEVATNSLGLRDDEPAATGGPGVLLLGDSFAMGYGVERPRIFADLLERELSVNVINAGTGGYELIQQPRVVAELGARFRPAVVVYFLYLGNDLAQNDEWEVRSDSSLHNRVREYPVRQSSEIKLASLARNVLYGVRKGRSEKEGEWLPFEGYLGLCERNLGEEAIADYDLADKLLGELSNESGKLGVPLLVVLLPYRSMVEPEALASLARKVPDLEARYDLSRPAREIGARLQARGIAYFDATPFLVEEHRRHQVPLFFPIDGHLTEAGHQAVASFTGPRIREALGEGRHL